MASEPSLFGDSAGRNGEVDQPVEHRRIVRVLPDEPAIAKTFDYLVPDGVGDQVRVGTRVRIALGPRRVGGWVVAIDVEAPAGVALRPLAKISGHGPTPDLIELAQWAAWRWAGRPASFLRTASPERTVTALPTPPRRSPQSATPALDPLVRLALDRARAVLRLPPAADLSPVISGAAALGNALVLCPTADMARTVAGGLYRDGIPVARHPRDWALGAAGATVVGTRAAAWAPVAELAAVVVVDEHDEAHAQEQAPTWHARDVAIERARRAGAPCLLLSPVPSLEALAWAGDPLVPARTDERAGWPVVDVVDRRHDDPRSGLFSPRLVELLRSDRRVVCILNRTGRAKLLACTACGELARCAACGAAVVQLEEHRLSCPRCGATRPQVCADCGGTRMKLLRQGVSRVREELEALVGQPVGEIAGSRQAPGDPGERVVVGTEAALHQIDRADVVAFLDVDQEALAPRYRAAEQALALLARAARLLGGKAKGGRLVLQTRLPRHDVVQAVLQADPARFAQAEADRRSELRFPPTTALAEVSGASAGAFVGALSPTPEVEVMGPADGRWLIRAPDHRRLCDALAATPRPPGRLRLAVEPLRV